MNKIAAIIACVLLSLPVHAEGISVSAKLSSLGLGVDLTKSFSDSINGRVGINGYNYNKNATQNQIAYDMNLQLQTLTALGDWHPWQGSFRASGGLVYNNNKLHLTALPTGMYNINGTNFLASDVGTLDANISFNKVAPYFGIGWGNPVAKDKSWGFVADVGVLFQGSPKTSLIASCTAAGNCPPGFDAQLAAEQQKLQDSLKDFKFYPVISVGLSYQF